MRRLLTLILFPFAFITVSCGIRDKVYNYYFSFKIVNDSSFDIALFDIKYTYTDENASYPNSISLPKGAEWSETYIVRDVTAAALRLLSLKIKINNYLIPIDYSSEIAYNICRMDSYNSEEQITASRREIIESFSITDDCIYRWLEYADSQYERYD